MDEEDELVASLPVFLNGAPGGAPAGEHDAARTPRLELFQYPLYQRDHALPVPASAAQRGQAVASRWRPQANRVEMELPLDVRPTVYNAGKGAEYAEATERLGKIPVPGQVKQERPMTDTPRFDRMRLESAAVPNAAEYMICTVKNGVYIRRLTPGELHLTPLHAVLQMRPSMQHVDMLHEAEANERHGRAPASDDDGDTQQQQPAADKRAGVVSLNVSVRTDTPRAGLHVGRTPHHAHDADAERWVDLRWVDESAPGAWEAAEAQLLSPVRTPLYCNTRARDFL